MSAPRHHSRVQVLTYHAGRMIAETSVSEAVFAQRVAAVYLERVPEHARSLAFKPLRVDMTVEEYTRAIDSNKKLVERYMNGTTHLPAEVEEAWVAALDVPYRRRCIHDLCARYMVLPVPLDLPADEAGLADVVRESSEALGSEAPLIADGRLDARDAPQAPAAMREHLEAAATHVARAVQIGKKTGTSDYMRHMNLVGLMVADAIKDGA